MTSSGQKRDLVRAAERVAREEASEAPPAHDWWHVQRVRDMAVRIARAEGADLFVVELGALLHEVGDAKAAGTERAGERLVEECLHRLSFGRELTDSVVAITSAVSYRGAGVPDRAVPLEGRCVRDADRLDAMGAIGIARAFAYGGSINRPIHDPGEPPLLHSTAEEYRTSDGTTVNHFAEKLLILRDRMETSLGRELAAHRHEVMVRFLAEFRREWDATA